MAFSIPGITQPEYSVATQGAKAIDQLHMTDPSAPMGLSSTSCSFIAPDKVERNSAPSNATYDANVLHRVGASAHLITSGAAAAVVGAADHLGPDFGQLVSKAAAAARGAARSALPVAGDALEAAGMVIAVQSPAGESEADLAKTRALDAAGRQRMESMAHPSAAKSNSTTFPGQHIDVGPNHTTLPANVRGKQDGIFTTPAESQSKLTHTGHAAPEQHVLTKPTGTTIYRPSAADQAMFGKRENIVTPAHAAHLTPSGTLANAEHASGIDEKLKRYSLNDQHVDGMHKARVFKSALGYDGNNLRELGKQIKEGIGREPASPGKVDEHGVRFTVDVPINGPAGAATVRTGWIYRPGANAPTMITGFVK